MMINFIKSELALTIFLFVLIILVILYPNKITDYPSFVDWKTIVALTGLLIITTGLRESGYLSDFAAEILKRTKTERAFALLLIFISILLSTFLMNDVTLFIVIPLTIAIQSFVKNDTSKLIIFEAISVNVGSSLTPIGNPQNLFLWHMWGISFLTFIAKMIPLVVFLLVVLLIFAWIVFPNKKIEFLGKINNGTPNKTLFIFSVVALLFYVFSLEIGKAYLALPIILMLYIVFYKSILLKTDWLILLLFVVIFIDFHIISTIPCLSKFTNALNLHSAGNTFWFSVVTSQLISNVPASIFVSMFSHNWLAITYGVNVGGNGFVLGSLANIIALRMAGNRKTWLDFHRYSIPYLLITAEIAYVAFFA